MAEKLKTEDTGVSLAVANAARVTAHCFQVGGVEPDFHNIVGSRFAELLQSRDAFRINSRNDIHRLLVKTKAEGPCSFVLCTQATKGKLVNRIEIATRADWLLLFVQPYESEAEQYLLNIWLPLAAVMGKNTIVVFDPALSPKVVDGFNKTCGKLLTARRHVLVPVQLPSTPDGKADSFGAFAQAGLAALMSHLPPQSVFSTDGIPVDDAHVDIIPAAPVDLPGMAAIPSDDRAAYKEEWRRRFASLSPAENFALARAEYTARCALPLRLIQVCSFSKISVTQFVVAEGVLRLGDRLVVASDPGHSAVEGNTVFSMRLFPENVPIAAAYPGQYIGVQTALHTRGAEPSPFDCQHTVAGRVSDKCLFPRTPALVAGFANSMLRGDVSIVGIGGAQPLQIVSCEKQQGAHMVVAIARSTSKSTYCDDFNMFRVTPCASWKKFILLHRAVDGALSATNGFVPVAVALASEYRKLDVHYAAAKLLRRHPASAPVSPAEAAEAERALTAFAAGHFLHSSAFKKDSDVDDAASEARRDAYCTKHSDAFERLVMQELLSILTPAQHQLGLEPVSDRRCGRFTLLFMLSQLENPQLFIKMLTKIVTKAARGELPLHLLPHHWIPTSMYDEAKAQPNSVLSELLAACCTTQRKVRDVSRVLAENENSNLEALMVNSFISTGVLMPVYDMIRARASRPLSDGDIATYLQSPSLPCFILLQLAVRGSFGARTIDFVLKKASQHVRRHALRWLAVGAGCNEGQKLTTSTLSAIIGTITVEDIVRLYLYHSAMSARRVLEVARGCNCNGSQWTLPLRAIHLIAQFL